jgi:hypothetical protein
MTGAVNITSTLSPTLITDFTFTAANDVVYIGIYDNEGQPRYRRAQYGINFPYIVPGVKRIEDRIPAFSSTGLAFWTGRRGQSAPQGRCTWHRAT